MSITLTVLRNWNAWYRVLRYRNGFRFLESVRYGLWLARCASRDEDERVSEWGSDGKPWFGIRCGARTLFRDAPTDAGAAHRHRPRAFA